MLPTTDALLVAGGDARIAPDAVAGLNRYGCAPTPLDDSFDFASSTASTISPYAYRAAADLRERLAIACAHEPAASVYARELEAARRALIDLNGLGGMDGLEIVFAASGTDLHLIVGGLVGGEPDKPLLCLGVESEETGSGVPQALAGRHFSDRAAFGCEVDAGAPASPHMGDYVSVAARNPDGTLREGADIEAELDAEVFEASRVGRKVLLTVADVSKTGLIAPGLDAVMALRHRFPRSLEVLVDACQFRLSPATLRAYLDAGFMVAVTGSKFLSGPCFSGALFVPASSAERLRDRIVNPGFGLYSARAEWPAAWHAPAALPEAANFGLLLRWRAALVELEAFRAIPDAAVAGFLSGFADAVEARLSIDGRLASLPTRTLDRRALEAPRSWDLTPTIFPIRLRGGSEFLSPCQAQSVYRALRDTGVRLGQPVAGGALRLCASARLVVTALGERGIGPEAVVRRAMTSLDRAVAFAAQA